MCPKRSKELYPVISFVVIIPYYNKQCYIRHLPEITLFLFILCYEGTKIIKRVIESTVLNSLWFFGDNPDITDTFFAFVCIYPVPVASFHVFPPLSVL